MIITIFTLMFRHHLLLVASLIGLVSFVLKYTTTETFFLKKRTWVRIFFRRKIAREFKSVNATRTTLQNFLLLMSCARKAG